MSHKQSNLSKNIIYNLILTVSGYVFPILTFPYVTRVLGPASYGTANFVLGIVDYAVMLSTLGISTIGIREIAKCSGNEKELNNVFSSLCSVHLLLASFIAVIYIGIVFVVGELRENYYLYLIGLIKIISNVFLIEWLYGGLQNFKYITVRSIYTKILYVICIFLFVKNQSDYLIFILITVLQVFVNSIINWGYSKRFVLFKFSTSDTRKYIGPSISLGINMILLSFYGTFIVMYLGFVCNSSAVGYYTTATKIYAILLSLLSAFNSGLIPYINSLYGQGNETVVKEIVSKSLNLILMISVPIAVYGFFMADDIVTITAGVEYQKSILPFKILIFNLILVGISQVTELQVLLTLNKTKQILFCTGISVFSSVIIMVLFARQYAEIAAAYAVMLPHVLEASLLFYFAKRYMNFNIPWKSICLYICLSIVIIAIITLSKDLFENMVVRIGLSFVMVVLTYVGGGLRMKDPIICMLKNKLIVALSLNKH